MLKLGTFVCILMTTSANFTPTKRHLLKDSNEGLERFVAETTVGKPGLLDARGIVPVGLQDDLVLNAASGALDGLVVTISDSFQPKECKEILENIKAGVDGLSGWLHQQVEVQLGEVSLRVPASWTNQHCATTIRPAENNQVGLVEVIPGLAGQSGWTQQRLGCGQPGDKLTLPYSQLVNASAPVLGNLWLRLRYGVFSALDSAPDPASRQYSECRGRTVSEVVKSHPDFSAPRPHANYTPPRYTVVQPTLPRFILVLENSAAMNLHDHWESVRTACKKLILHDLPEEVELGLVLYNEEAHISHPVGRLGKKTISPTRNGLAFSIRNKHNLSPSNGSCVSCGLLKAVEALQTSARGGVVVLVGRAGLASSRDAEHMRKLALKHRLQVFPVVVPGGGGGGLDQALNLELLAHATRASSFILHHNPNHSIYMHLLDALRVIKENTIPGSNKLIYSRRFEGSRSERAESDSFVVDPFSGLSTELEVYFPDSAESHIKSLSVSDPRSARFSTVMDTTQALHYYSLYNVPFGAGEGEGGERWNYSLVRLPSENLDNVHVVQVTSAPSPHQALQVHLSTNIPDYQANLSPETPLILFAEVKLNQRPVLNARVVAEVSGTNRAGLPIPATQLSLTDSGSGDPDKFAGDGVYSRYMTSIAEEGIYTITLHVSSSKASPAGLKTVSGARNLPEFSRIVSGFSFRVETLQRSTKDSFPPSRIMDLSVSELSGSQELELRWTAPGDDYDSGAPSSYQIYYSEDPASFYLDGAPPQLVERFKSRHIPAGEQDQHRINVQEFNKNLYYAIVAVDDEGNVGEISNIVRAYMHRQVIIPSGHSSVAGKGNLREGLFNPFEVIEGPNRVIMYAIVGVVTMVVLTFIVVTIIVVVSRKLKRREHEDVDGTSNQNGSFKDSDLLRFSSVDLNVNKEAKPDNFISRVDPYTELITDSNYTSQDKLFYSSENLYHQVKITSRSEPDPSMMNTTAIYAKPLPKNERKSILKKPREDGDGDSEPSEVSEVSECTNSYLETDFDIASLRKGPPTLPKPAKPDLAPREQVYSPIFIDSPAPEFNPPLCSPDSMYCSVYVQEQTLVQNLDLTQHLQGGPPPAAAAAAAVTSPDVLSQTSSRRVRNCTQV